jgi:SpoVK/Ycf46/Vps4 family AAA+-type ATPase
VFLGVFRKATLQEVGAYDETLHRAQDWELNYRLRRAGHLVYFTPDLRVVYHPRDSWRALARQFFTTGQWRREVARRHPDTLSLRYLAPPLTVLGLGGGLLGGLLGLTLRNNLLTALLVAPAAYVAFVVAATASMPSLSPAARLRFPVVLAVMHLFWGAGFVRGLPQ